MQIEMSKAGVVCQDIAKAIHEYQVLNGMEKPVSAGCSCQGNGGSQEFCIALGDQIILEERMTFSMESDLFNPGSGFGYNPSDSVVVGEKSGWV